MVPERILNAFDRLLGKSRAHRFLAGAIALELGLIGATIWWFHLDGPLKETVFPAISLFLVVAGILLIGSSLFDGNPKE